jgi:SAM-dependent methyltransferase
MNGQTKPTVGGAATAFSLGSVSGMAVSLWHSASDQPDSPAPQLNASTHRSRAALERVLVDPHDDAAYEALAAAYDEMAPEWTEWARDQHWYAASVAAGLAHAQPVSWIVEVGCGTGQATGILSGIGAFVVATDVNSSMLLGAPALAHTAYVQADVRHLPFADGSVPLLVGLNGVPHIPEFQRVVAPGGQILWCTSFAEGTPLYVSPDRFADMLGPEWTAEAGYAGHGDWVLALRPK